MIEDKLVSLNHVQSIDSYKLKNSGDEMAQATWRSDNIDSLQKSLKSDAPVMLPSMFESPQQQMGLSIKTNGLPASDVSLSHSGDFCVSLSSSLFSESTSGLDDSRDSSLNAISSIGNHVSSLSAGTLPLQDLNIAGYGSTIDISTSQFSMSAFEASPGLNWMNQSKVRKRKQTSPLLSKFIEENMIMHTSKAHSTQSASFDYGYSTSELSNGLYMNGSPTTYSNSSGWNNSVTGYGSHLNSAIPSIQTDGFYNSNYALSSGLIAAPSASVSMNAATIKVPMAPVRIIQQESKKTVPLLLPFHHKNDNRIIPQTFHHQSFLLSPDEIYSVKSNFLSRIKEIDFDNITVVELKNFLREFNLASGGKKSILVERIRQISEWLKNERSGQPHNESFLSQYHHDSASTSTFHSGVIPSPNTHQSSGSTCTNATQYSIQSNTTNSSMFQTSNQDKLITQNNESNEDLINQSIVLEINSNIVI